MNPADFLAIRELSDDDILSKIPLSKLFDNSGYFHGLADTWRHAQNGVIRGYYDTSTEFIVWDGWHILQTDAKTFNYHIELANDDGGHLSTLTLYYAYGQAEQVTIASRSSDGISSGTYDLSGVASGFYRVTAIMTRSPLDISYDAVAHVRPPYTTYTGSRAFQTAPTIVDGTLSTASDFNKWRSNQLYFYDQLAPNTGFVSQYRNWNASEASLIVWDGFIFHRFRRMRYLVWLRKVEGGNRLRLYYDYGGANQYCFADITDTTQVVRTADLPASVYTPGTQYRVTAVMTRSDTNVRANVRIRYIMETPIAATTGYTGLGSLTAGQYVFGDTAGEGSRLALLSANQTNLNGRLTRRDYALRVASYEDVGDVVGYHWVIHRFPYLYYRGTDLIMKWADSDYESLPDTDDGANLYRVLDLRALPNMVRGVHYHIEGGSKFAAEVKSSG